jgi:hypothetical protein
LSIARVVAVAIVGMNPHTIPMRLILICSSLKAVSGVACMSIRRPSTSSVRRSALRRCTRSSRYSRSPPAASSALRVTSGSSFTLTKMSSNMARVHRISVSSSGPGVPSQRAASRAGARLATSATFSCPPSAAATSSSAVCAMKSTSAGTSERGAARRRIEMSRS